ncbi:MAG TPA: extracellular solute-binding protein [Pseudonocardia sp.]|jgi:multiple sugar transport system substrate-binding protein|nr:extracellular solute-binding protein [Pseudonocardia sp.]
MARGVSLRRREVLAAGGAIALTAAIAACGSNTGRPSGGSTGPTLSQWYHQYGEPGVEQAVRRYANYYPRARVRVQWRPGDYDRETATALLTDTGPDVFETDGPTIDQIRAGQVVDLSAAIGGASGDFNPIFLSTRTYQGKVYSIPQVADMQLLYYRKSMLASARIEPPRTLDALVAAARALTTDEVKGLFLGNDGGAGALGATPLYAAGAPLITEAGTVGFSANGVAPTLAKLHRLYSDGSLLLGAPTDWSNPSAFTQGLTAMQWSGLWVLPQITAALGDDFGVLPFPPDGSAGRPAVPVGAYGCAVNARSPRRDLAVDYARWLWVERLDYQRDFALSYGLHLPARLSIASGAQRLTSGTTGEAVAFSTRYGHPAWPLLMTTRARTALQDALTRIIQSGADPVAELSSAIQTVEAELARVRKPV